MPERCRDGPVELALKAAPCVRVIDSVPGEHLECHTAVELRVVGQEDLAHAAFAQLFQDLIAPQAR
jgi:hypothetical protein